MTLKPTQGLTKAPCQTSTPPKSTLNLTHSPKPDAQLFATLNQMNTNRKPTQP